ncbi:hypothetical protein F4818DRAFT_453416 [Hypoxylon cercidicola]|nr:hypothetical protein F4818DRAFT_453416 [Hypoxylon cercidicola]
MLRFCDAILSKRNDLAKAPVGQYKIWTGGIDPVWPNNVTATPITTGGEQERAKTYLEEADAATINHISKRLLDVSNDKMYFAKDSPYMGGKPVPWNQQMMFNYAFVNLCDTHRILPDNPQLLGKYKSIIVASMNWLFHGGGVQTGESKKGNPIYIRGYTMPKTSGEDPSRQIHREAIYEI